MNKRTLVARQDLVDLIELLPCNPHVRPGEPAEIEHPVEYCHRFGTKLAINILFFDDYRVFGLIKTNREVGLTQPVDGRKDRMRYSPIITQVGILPFMSRW